MKGHTYGGFYALAKYFAHKKMNSKTNQHGNVIKFEINSK